MTDQTTDLNQSSLVVTPEHATLDDVAKKAMEMTSAGNQNMTNEETKQTIDALNSSNDDKAPVDKPTVLPKATKPIEVAKPKPAKEVKPVAEVKDPKGMFDYTGCEQYTVQDGDTLFDVAQKYKIALQQLRYFNHVNKATFKIRPGQVLYIPTKPVYVPVGK